MTRYRIGFENEHVKSTFTERNPGYIPIVDTRTPFAFGSVVAIVDGQELADKICQCLNQESGQTQ